MHIRGTDNPRCALCANCREAMGGTKLFCIISESETTAKNSCGKFKYDIFKYKGTDKARLGRFKKEDFQL